MVPVLVTAMMYFFKPNLSSWVSDIVNLAKCFKSNDPSLLKSSKDCKDEIMTSIKSAISSLILKAMLNGTCMSFPARDEER